MKKFYCFITENNEFHIIPVVSRSREKVLRLLKNNGKYDHLILTYDRYQYYKVEKEEFKKTHYNKFNTTQQIIINEVMFSQRYA